MFGSHERYNGRRLYTQSLRNGILRALNKSGCESHVAMLSVIKERSTHISHYFYMMSTASKATIDIAIVVSSKRRDRF